MADTPMQPLREWAKIYGYIAVTVMWEKRKSRNGGFEKMKRTRRKQKSVLKEIFKEIIEEIWRTRTVKEKILMGWLAFWSTLLSLGIMAADSEGIGFIIAMGVVLLSIVMIGVPVMVLKYEVGHECKMDRKRD